MNTQQGSRPTASATMSGSARSYDATDGTASGSSSSNLRAKTDEAIAKAADVAQQVGAQAKQTASSLAADANQRTKGFLNQRVTGGAVFAGHIADSARCAADNLGAKAPQLAEFVRGAAGRVDQFSEQMRDKSVDELLNDASDFTRKQPAFVFGLASLAGFLLFRVLKANPSTERAGGSGRNVGQFHGT